MLSLALADPGRLAVPIEYFNGSLREVLVRRWSCAGDLDSYLGALYSHRTTRDGLLGVKLHWNQLMGLRTESLGPEHATDNPYGLDAAFLEALLPACRYIWIVREDIVAQAVSLFLAMSTGRWEEWSTPPAGLTRERVPTPPYDFGYIDRCRCHVEREDACWARFFRASGITPLVVVYEELEKAYAETLRATVEFIGIEADHSPVLPPPIRKQRDDTSEEYAQAYLRDRAIRGADEPGRLSQDSSWS